MKAGSMRRCARRIATRRISWIDQGTRELGDERRFWGRAVCNRNIEMTPLRKVQMAPSCYSGLQENGADDGGVDERQGVFATGRPARFGGGSYHDPGCG